MMRHARTRSTTILTRRRSSEDLRPVVFSLPISLLLTLKLHVPTLALYTRALFWATACQPLSHLRLLVLSVSDDVLTCSPTYTIKRLHSCVSSCCYGRPTGRYRDIKVPAVPPTSLPHFR